MSHARRCLPFCLALLATQAVADAHPPIAYTQDGPVQVAGVIEVVLDWTRDRCVDDHNPDLPVRAFRDGTGRICLIPSHHEARRMTGTDFRDLQMECAALTSLARNLDADMFSNHEWIAATWIEGVRVHALEHNAYQGNRYSGCASRDCFSCWCNTIT